MRAVLVVTLAMACGFQGQALPGESQIDAPTHPTDAAVGDATGVDATAPSCPSSAGWSAIAGSHYYFSPVASEKHWWEAEADCVARGAGFAATHLAAITSRAEAVSVGAAMGGVLYAWIGMFQPLGSTTKSGDWRVVTGGSALGGDWAPNEPNDGGDSTEAGDENFAQIYPTGSLNDTQGEDTLRYICECDGVAPDPATLAMVPPKPP